MTGSLPSVQRLYEVTERTWPPAEVFQSASWSIRDGRGGGKRVSAATTEDRGPDFDLAEAECAIRALGQTPLFMIREGEEVLDSALDASGYTVIDPVNMYACPVEMLATDMPPRLTSFDIWPPLAIQSEIWAEGGIGAARIAVMARVAGPKTALFGRHDGRAAATGFVAVHEGVAMVHALEVLEPYRGNGMGRYLTRHAAFWATAQGATHLAVLCTKANVAANALYSSLGMTVVGEYHYRVKEG